MPSMTSINLFEINPDKLFEQCSIEEIHSTQVKLQHEIERKREELRTMVGERYRDLIEAADTIAEMKEISRNVIGDIENVSVATEEMYKKHQRPENRRLKDPMVRHLQLNVNEKIAVQLKVLIALPEQIWVSIDSEDYAKASMLFLLARHIKTGLEINNISCPMLEHQWSMIAQFKETILKAAEKMLKEQMIIPDLACNCFMAIALLESKCSKDLVSCFLELRSDALRNLLTPEDSFEDGDKVKTRFLSSHTLITFTSLILYSCFIESPSNNGEGLLWKKLKEITGKETNLMTNLLTDIDCDLLPSVVTNYRPLPGRALEPVPPGEMAAFVAGWLGWVHPFVGDSGRVLLEKLNSLRSLQGLLHASQEPPAEWPSVAQRLMQPLSTLDAWRSLYRPLVVERARLLVTAHWRSSLDDVQRALAEVAASEGGDGCARSEADLRWHVWKEAADDLTSDSSHRGGLWLKSRAISLRTATMCRATESQLASLMADLAGLCPPASDSDSDGHMLRAHQQTACLSFVAGLIRFACEEVEGSGGEAAPALYARYLQTVPQLCPSLRTCLSLSLSKTQGAAFSFKVKGGEGVGEGEVAATDAWHSACFLLAEGAASAWAVWRDRCMESLGPDIAEVLGHSHGHGQTARRGLDCLLHTIPQWEVVHIEEVGEEEGQPPLSSELRVPSAPSLPLASLLAKVNAALSQAFAPTYATELVVANVLREVVRLYGVQGQREGEEPFCPAHAWQRLFDLKYIALLLISPENKELQSVCQAAVSSIERSVDPFDLDVFAPHIQENVRKALRDTQLMLGVLSKLRTVPPSPLVVPGAGASPSIAPRPPNEDPSILALSATGSSVWFPLLPITAPPGTRAVGCQGTPATKAKSGGKGEVGGGGGGRGGGGGGDVPTRAVTSFFGSMTADWFG